MFPEPRLDRGFVHPAGFVEPDEPVVSFQVLEDQSVTVQQKKNAGGGDRSPLISVQKRMILRQALEKRRCFLTGVHVVSALEPSNRGVQSSAVAKPVDSAELANHLGVDLNDFVYG